LLLGYAIVLTCLYGFALHHANSQLRVAMAEAAADTPNWQRKELEASRAAVPEAKNSAKIVQSIVEELPDRWMNPDGMPLYERLNRLPSPNGQLTVADLASLRAELDRVRPALRDAQRLSGIMMEGRAEVDLTNDMFAEEFTYAQNSRRVVRLLQLDVFLKIHENNGDAALADCRAILNVGRSIGDEPAIIPQLARIAEGNVALQLLERILANGEPTDQALRSLDVFLAEESDTPHLLVAIRGERAWHFDFLKRFRYGLNSSPPIDGWALKFTRPYVVENQGRDLQIMNQAVQAVNEHLPADRLKAIRGWSSGVKPTNSVDHAAGLVAYILVPELEPLIEATIRYRASLQCGRTLIALERFRRENHRWPDSLSDLVPKYLNAVPLDPRDDKPIHMARLPDGLVVYSVGSDLVDNGGKIDPTFKKTLGYDFGYRLWNLDARRKSAPRMQTKLPENVFQADGLKSS
jgi:hypothetical protein